MDNYLFIDDSGSKGWDTPYSKDFVDCPPARNNQNLNFWRSNYFVLAGLHINRDTMAKLNKKINKKKIEVFGTKYVDLHSSDLRNPYRIKRMYLDKFNITREQLRDFIDNFWYRLYDDEKIQLVAIIIDKRYFLNARNEGKEPLEIAVEALFDRTEWHPHSRCKIVFDQMDSQIKTVKRDQGKILKITNTQINLNDGKYRNKYHHTSVRFENSLNSNFLQMADIVAYNTWRQFVEYGDEWDKHGVEGEHRKLPTYPYFERISNKFWHNAKSGRVSGYGIAKIPDPFNRSRGWNIGQEEK